MNGLINYCLKITIIAWFWGFVSVSSAVASAYFNFSQHVSSLNGLSIINMSQREFNVIPGKSLKDQLINDVSEGEVNSVDASCGVVSRQGWSAFAPVKSRPDGSEGIGFVDSEGLWSVVMGSLLPADGIEKTASSLLMKIRSAHFSLDFFSDKWSLVFAGFVLVFLQVSRESYNRAGFYLR